MLITVLAMGRALNTCRSIWFTTVHIHLYYVTFNLGLNFVEIGDIIIFMVHAEERCKIQDHIGNN